MALALVGKIDGRSVCHFLREGEQTVGRAATCHVRLPVSSVSRTHATLTLEGGKVTVVDLGSSYGTFVNGTAVTGPRRLEPGDMLMFADTELKLVETTPPAQTIYPENGSSTESSSVTLDEVIGQSNLFRILAEAGELLATRHSLDELYGLGYDRMERMGAVVRSVSMDDVQRLSEEVFGKGHLVVVASPPGGEGESGENSSH